MRGSRTGVAAHCTNFTLITFGYIHSIFRFFRIHSFIQIHSISFRSYFYVSAIWKEFSEAFESAAALWMWLRLLFLKQIISSTHSILTQHEISTTDTLHCTLSDFSARYVPSKPAVPERSMQEWISQKYTYWRIIPVWVANVLIGVFIASILYR